MRQNTLPRTPARARSPAQRWVVGLVLQALMALLLASGPRAVMGPLHWHGPGADHAAHAGGPAGGLARHHHEGDVEAVTLDEGAPAPEDVGHGSSAQVAVAPGPAADGPAPAPLARARRGARPPAVAWVDADLPRPKPPPRG